MTVNCEHAEQCLTLLVGL